MNGTTAPRPTGALTYPVMLLLDDRVGSADLAPALRNLGVVVDVTRLPFADAALLGRGEGDRPIPVGVEIKTVGDLMASMTSGRLSGHQLPGLLASYEWVWLLVEGRYRPDPGTGTLQVVQGAGWAPLAQGPRTFLYRDLAHFLQSLEIRGGLHIAHTDTRSETARWISALCTWWEKPWDEHRAHLALHHKASTRPRELVPPSLVRRVAAELPGIGWTRSGEVSAHFKTVRELATADEAAWQLVDGVGKKLARQLVRALGGPNG